MKELENDRRTRLTKALIRQAFTSLLEEKPIQRIAVTELCQRAGINRSTFYAHYDDIYDLLQQIEEDMLRDFQQALAPLLEADLEMLSPLQITTGIYRCLKDNADLCTVTLGEHGDKAFAARLLSSDRERSMNSYARYFQGASPQQIDEFFAFVSGGHIALLQKWVSDGMAASAEEMAATAENIMLYGIGFLRNNTPPERKNIP